MITILIIAASNDYSRAQNTSVSQDTIPVVQAPVIASDSLKNLPYSPTSRPDDYQRDRWGDPFSNPIGSSPLLYGDPSNLIMDFELDTGLNF